ncbi:MAG: hypothetical protein CSA35_05820 [Dethiosulfovibrio peptidovorans]|nr:MAG: hypothetical protein CSA35_05820 [Dethiosulfovibrio peptidovorans]
MAWRAHFDGGSRGNPGVAGAGAVLYDDAGLLVWRGSRPLGRGTNNEAEYEGAIMAVEEAARRGLKEITLCGDSKLVIQQLSGVWKIKEPRLQVLAERFRRIASGIAISYRWIARAENDEADRMANQAMDDIVGESIKKESKEVDQYCSFEAVTISDTTGRFEVDLRGRRCSCPVWEAEGDCPHLRACQRAGLLPSR